VASTHPIGSDALLNAAIVDLGFSEGQLLSADKQMSDATRGDWVEKGDWLSLAKFVGAEKVFFVEQNPVIVFARTDANDLPSLRELYNRIWCMARPQLLFLARPGELSVYDLSKPPVASDESLDAQDRLISDTVRTIAEVQFHLRAFRREEIETGSFFEAAGFAPGGNRADKALIRDLRIVRQQLLDQGLPARYAHSLIGRSIFIRYLEDRAILLPEYFENVARTNQKWSRILDRKLPTPAASSDMEQIRYLRVLEDHAFTYKLFQQLASDFNGDMFPVDEAERSTVTSQHLALLRNLLIGNTSDQQQLFFYAYSFDVIPIELISSIYEEFYNEQQGKTKNHGSHYTPSVLVDFVLTRTLTEEVLAQEPRVMDPACGSGIFLVEAFRRIVRYQMWKQGGKRLSRPQLRRILRDQIAGIDINEEAIRVAAFSLYLAFLHYQEPREINEQRKLPNLKWSQDNHEQREQYFSILLHGNAFEIAQPTRSDVVAKRFGMRTSDVILGNPPWGYPKVGDDLGRTALKATLTWCRDNHLTIGDNELSQAFLHLSNFLLRDGGTAGLLVSTGVFFKQQDMSRRFRKQWLNEIQLHHVVNFAQVRHLFFRGATRKAEAIAPFAAVVFTKRLNDPNHRFAYWSAKRTAFVENTQAVVLSKADMNWLSQEDCTVNENLWKIFWWGSYRDEALIRALERFHSFARLSELVPGSTVEPNIGFVEGRAGRVPSDWLNTFKILPSSAFASYGPLPVGEFAPAPDFVRRRGAESAYQGHRLLVRRGIQSPGRLTVRLENRKFAFTHSIFSFGLRGLQDWQEKVLLGIFWSDLARYYLFLTTGSWGMWHDELSMASIARMPIVMPSNAAAIAELIEIVDELRASNFNATANLFNGNQVRSPEELLKRLNQAVFELYELNAAERDLIADMCGTGLDFLYQKQASSAIQPLSLPTKRIGFAGSTAKADTEIEQYIQLFLRLWSKDLSSDARVEWQLFSSQSGAPLLAVLFTLRDGRSPKGTERLETVDNWTDVLGLLDKNTRETAGSRKIYIDSFVRLVTENAILLVKRNEKRFWTRTAARQDAEATQLQAMLLQEARR
jgi:type I restriction-modification system DNA methylase subunit